MTTIALPNADGSVAPFTLAEPVSFEVRPQAFNRLAFAAAHVVADPLADVSWFLDEAVDWDRTIAFRHHLWDHGFAVAEAMDTAQRGMGLSWPGARELFERSAREAQGRSDARLAAGAGTDHLDPTVTHDRAGVIAAYEMQCEAVEQAGAQIILMASRALAAQARDGEDYAAVYDRILAQVREPVIIHWLGDMFDPALAGYWGADDADAAMASCLDVIGRNAAKVDGIKISLLDADKERAMRAQLPDGVRMYTGDDFNFADLIAPQDGRYSDALLGIFDAIAPAAGAALTALGEGDEERFNALLAPTVPLSRLIFAAPTRFYKTGVVFLAYLNGHQDHFIMLGGQQASRSAPHLAEVFRLASTAGLLADPERAAQRMAAVMAQFGVDTQPPS